MGTTTIAKTKIRLAFLLLAAFVGPLMLSPLGELSAETLRLRQVYSEEEKLLELEEQGRAKISVYLAGHGNRVDNYSVILAVKDGEFWREIDSKKSDSNGIVSFRNVESGLYIVYLRKTTEQLSSAGVGIGDLTLEEEEPYL